MANRFAVDIAPLQTAFGRLQQANLAERDRREREKERKRIRKERDKQARAGQLAAVGGIVGSFINPQVGGTIGSALGTVIGGGDISPEQGLQIGLTVAKGFEQMKQTERDSVDKLALLTNLMPKNAPLITPTTARNDRSAKPPIRVEDLQGLFARSFQAGMEKIASEIPPPPENQPVQQSVYPETENIGTQAQQPAQVAFDTQNQFHEMGLVKASQKKKELEESVVGAVRNIGSLSQITMEDPDYIKHMETVEKSIRNVASVSPEAGKQLREYYDETVVPYTIAFPKGVDPNTDTYQKQLRWFKAATALSREGGTYEAYAKKLKTLSNSGVTYQEIPGGHTLVLQDGEVKHVIKADKPTKQSMSNVSGIGNPDGTLGANLRHAITGEIIKVAPGKHYNYTLYRDPVTKETTALVTGENKSNLTSNQIEVAPIYDKAFRELATSLEEMGVGLEGIEEFKKSLPDFPKSVLTAKDTGQLLEAEKDLKARAIDEIAPRVAAELVDLTKQEEEEIEANIKLTSDGKLTPVMIETVQNRYADIAAKFRGYGSDKTKAIADMFERKAVQFLKRNTKGVANKFYTDLETLFNDASNRKDDTVSNPVAIRAKAGKLATRARREKDISGLTDENITSAMNRIYETLADNEKAAQFTLSYDMEKLYKEGRTLNEKDKLALAKEVEERKKLENVQQNFWKWQEQRNVDRQYLLSEKSVSNSYMLGKENIMVTRRRHLDLRENITFMQNHLTKDGELKKTVAENTNWYHGELVRLRGSEIELKNSNMTNENTWREYQKSQDKIVNALNADKHKLDKKDKESLINARDAKASLDADLGKLELEKRNADLTIKSLQEQRDKQGFVVNQEYLKKMTEAIDKRQALAEQTELRIDQHQRQVRQLSEDTFMFFKSNEDRKFFMKRGENADQLMHNEWNRQYKAWEGKARLTTNALDQAFAESKLSVTGRTGKTLSGQIISTKLSLEEAYRKLINVQKNMSDIQKDEPGLFNTDKQGWVDEWVGGVFGRLEATSPKYESLRAEMLNLKRSIVYALSGKQINEKEAKDIEGFIPMLSDSPARFQGKINSLRKSIEDQLAGFVREFGGTWTINDIDPAIRAGWGAGNIKILNDLKADPLTSGKSKGVTLNLEKRVKEILALYGRTAGNPPPVKPGTVPVKSNKQRMIDDILNGQ